MYIDMHCHPAMKPLGKSFQKKSTEYRQSKNPRDKSSLWYMDRAGAFERVLNELITVTKFSQADFSTLSYGKVGAICASLYPLEKGFVNTRVGDELIPDLLVGFVSGLSQRRVNHLDDMKNYFDDLVKEREFYEQMDGVEVNLERGKFKYKIADNYEELKLNLDNTAENIVSVFFSIEGGHVFNTGIHPKENTANREEVLRNVETVKSWEHKPLFLTLSHHFYNELCGHAPSLGGFVGKVLNQKRGLNEGFTQLGEEVVHKLLDKAHGNRILIDIKHMSEKSRQRYYEILDSDYKTDNIPLLVSHGGMNGLVEFTNNRYGHYDTSRKMMTGTINFYDKEVVRIAISGGLFCLQLDERRLIAPDELDAIKRKERKDDRLYYRSKIVWNQIQHIAEVLNDHGLDAWSTCAIGSDNDGIVDPLNGFWTAEFFPFLELHLQEHAFNYMNDKGAALLQKNQIEPDIIVSRVMYSNALGFLSRTF